MALYIRCNAKFQLEIIKVKSHSDNVYNNMVDHLAVKRRQELEVEE